MLDGSQNRNRKNLCELTYETFALFLSIQEYADKFQFDASSFNFTSHRYMKSSGLEIHQLASEFDRPFGWSKVGSTNVRKVL
jgi:hypothetical protein